MGECRMATPYAAVLLVFDVDGTVRLMCDHVDQVHEAPLPFTVTAS